MDDLFLTLSVLFILLRGIAATLCDVVRFIGPMIGSYLLRRGGHG